MAHLSELPDITTEPYKTLWMRAVVRTGKKLQRVPTTDEITEVYEHLLPRFTEPDGTVNIEKKAFVLPGLPYAYPDMPGLILREMNAEDIELIIPRMAYKDAETSRSAITARVNDPFTQMLAWEFQRKLVQTESLRLKPNGAVEIGTSVHCMHRSSEFWREIEKPVFERLLSLGVKEVSTLTLNSLLKYWRPIIEDIYKGRQGRVSPLTTEYTYPLDLSVFAGRTQRRTAGMNWQYELNGMSFHEMSREELPSVLEVVRGMYKDGQDIASQLDQKYTLDYAAVILGSKHGKTVSVRAIRPNSKTDGVGNYSVYNRMTAGLEESTGRQVMNLWAKLLGYTKLRVFLTEKQKQLLESHLVMQPDAKFVYSFSDRGVQMHTLETEL